MADDLHTIVQRMIDAGESEENIGTVIAHFHKYTPDPTMQTETASAIGRSQGLGFGVSRPPVKDELGRPLGGSQEPGTYAGGFVKGLKDYVLEHTVGNPALEAAARPQSASDLAALMLPNAPGAVSGMVQGAKDTAKFAGRLRLHPSALLDFKVTQPLKVFKEGVSLAPAEAPVPPAFGGSYMPPTAPPPRDPIVLSGPPTSAHTTGLSATDRALLAKQGYAPDVIAKIEQSLSPDQAAAQAAVHHAPVAAPIAPAVSGPQGVPASALGPEASTRAAMMNAAAPHPLTTPRVDIGAEAVGKAQGLTKQGVRDVTGPLYGEAPGEAAPVFPEQTYQRIAGKMRTMHPNPGDPAGDAAAWASRLDYANAAKDPKSLSQLIAMMRAWRDVHMAIPAAVGGGLLLRGRMVNQSSE